MQITFIIISSILLISNIIFIWLFLKKEKGKGLEKYDNLSLLSDLINNHRALIEVRRIDPSQIFLRSPKDIQ